MKNKTVKLNDLIGSKVIKAEGCDETEDHAPTISNLVLEKDGKKYQIFPAPADTTFFYGVIE